MQLIVILHLTSFLCILIGCKGPRLLSKRPWSVLGSSVSDQYAIAILIQLNKIIRCVPCDDLRFQSLIGLDYLGLLKTRGILRYSCIITLLTRSHYNLMALKQFTPRRLVNLPHNDFCTASMLLGVLEILHFASFSYFVGASLCRLFILIIACHNSCCLLVRLSNFPMQAFYSVVFRYSN